MDNLYEDFSFFFFFLKKLSYLPLLYPPSPNYLLPPKCNVKFELSARKRKQYDYLMIFHFSFKIPPPPLTDPILSW